MLHFVLADFKEGNPGVNQKLGMGFWMLGGEKTLAKSAEKRQGRGKRRWRANEELDLAKARWHKGTEAQGHKVGGREDSRKER